MNISPNRAELPSYFLEAVEEADIIDSFSYSSIEDWRRETPGKVIDLTLKVSFPIGRGSGQLI